MEGCDMAALVRHDSTTEKIFPRTDAETRADASEIARLYDALDCVSEHDNPRTARLLACGRTKIAQKLIEEAGEIALEAVRHRTRNVVRESADLVYHLVVLWHECGIAPDEVWTEMRRRADKLGIAEKLPKSADSHAAAVELGR
jgi:phosphoribosyl-ATP pyrophosphohydrolase